MWRIYYKIKIYHYTIHFCSYKSIEEHCYMHTLITYFGKKKTCAGNFCVDVTSTLQ